MPQVLTTNATVACLHAGVGTTAPTQFFWTVNGGLVCLDGDPGTVTGCTNLPPCWTYTLRSMKLNATQIMGRNAMLVTDFTLTNTGLPLLIADVGVTTYDDSTVAPLPATGTPTLPPALLDMTPPNVAAGPFLPAATFVSTSQTPAPIAVIYTLTADYPLQWVLSRTGMGSCDILTPGTTTGVNLQPAGGAWTVSPQQVTLTLDLPYLNGLAVGTHDFYMTAMTQRGISNYVIATLTVS